MSRPVNKSILTIPSIHFDSNSTSLNTSSPIKLNLMVCLSVFGFFCYSNYYRNICDVDSVDIVSLYESVWSLSSDLKMCWGRMVWLVNYSGDSFDTLGVSSVTMDMTLLRIMLLHCLHSLYGWAKAATWERGYFVLWFPRHILRLVEWHEGN